MTSEGTIVVGVDGSPISAAALRWAVAEAEVSGREVAAVTAWTYAPDLGPGAPTRPVEQVAASHCEMLDQLIDTMRRPGVTIRGELVEGEADEVLLDAARDADLLVLGSHGHGLLLRALVGSVSAYCLHHATCPVLILPAGVADPDGKAGSAAAAANYTPGPII